MKRDIVVIAHNLRSCHNVGSLLRTADGLGVSKVYLTGYTPYPKSTYDHRLPHLSEKITKQIHKTSLGAENSVDWAMNTVVDSVINELKESSYSVVALEQDSNATNLAKFKAESKVAIVLGNEVEGLDKDTLKLCDHKVFIPMLGSKESFNVIQAAAMCVYRMRYF